MSSDSTGLVRFLCIKCAKEIEVPVSQSGSWLSCPWCRDVVRVPDLVASSDPVTKRACPFCGEEILAVAIKCKHCGSAIDGKQGKTVKNTETLGVVAVVLPICSTFFAWVWLSSMPLLYDPGSKLCGLVAFTVLLTAILIAVEANSAGAGSDTDVAPNGKRRAGPIGWFFSALLFWAVGFPAWMHERKRYGKQSLFAASLLVGLIFIGVVSTMAIAIDSQRKEVRREIENAQREFEKAQREFQQTAEEAQRQLRYLRY